LKDRGVGGKCVAYGGEEKYTQSFGGEIGENGAHGIHKVK
jgi:hypothetical protein